MTIIQLAKPLCAPVNVFGVGDIVLFIVTTPATEDAVGTQVNKPYASRTTRPGQLMRKERIDGNTLGAIFRRFVLFDDPDAVDDYVRLICGQSFFDGFATAGRLRSLPPT